MMRKAEENQNAANAIRLEKKLSQKQPEIVAAEGGEDASEESFSNSGEGISRRSLLRDSYKLKNSSFKASGNTP